MRAARLDPAPLACQSIRLSRHTERQPTGTNFGGIQSALIVPDTNFVVFDSKSVAPDTNSVVSVSNSVVSVMTRTHVAHGASLVGQHRAAG